MVGNDSGARSLGGAGAQFTTTHWSVVLSASVERDSIVAAQALDRLCRTYWYALYVYVRRQGYDFHEAQDLTQEFFARLLEAQSLRSVDREKGKFRSFLLASMNHFLAKEWNRAHRQKRGGGRLVFSLDDDAAERRYLQELADHVTADKLYDRRWAMTVLEQAMSRLRNELAAQGKAAVFDELRSAISGQRGHGEYAQAAARLQMTEGAVKVTVHRLRKRYGELLRDEIAQTLANPNDIDDEIRDLFAALRE